MSKALLALPIHLRKRLQHALATGTLGSPCSAAALRATLGIATGGEEIATALADLASQGIKGRSAAAYIRALDEAAANTPRPDLVWSGPEVEGVHSRDTRRVYEELLGFAAKSLWVSTFAYFDGPRAFERLAKRMDEMPDLQATLLLNIQRRPGDTTGSADLVRRFADKFWNADWPGERRPSVYYDSRSVTLEGPSGILHAKALVADGESVFVTSANLTEAALDRNLELGLLVRDHALAASITAHFRTLIERQWLLALPRT